MTLKETLEGHFLVLTYQIREDHIKVKVRGNHENIVDTWIKNQFQYVTHVFSVYDDDTNDTDIRITTA